MSLTWRTTWRNGPSALTEHYTKEAVNMAYGTWIFIENIEGEVFKFYHRPFSESLPTKLNN